MAEFPYVNTHIAGLYWNVRGFSLLVFTRRKLLSKDFFEELDSLLTCLLLLLTALVLK